MLVCPSPAPRTGLEEVEQAILPGVIYSWPTEGLCSHISERKDTGYLVRTAAPRSRPVEPGLRPWSLASLTYQDLGQPFREHQREGKSRGMLTYQKQGYRSAQDEAHNHIRAVVPILGDRLRGPIPGRLCRGSRGTAHNWPASAALRLDCACDVHLGEDRDWGVTSSLCT